MPITSVYDLGTANVTQGSKQVTGTSVNWTGAGLREGDLFWCDGLTVRIEELVSNTELLLAHDWPGATGTDKDYEIQYTTDTSRVLAKSTQLISEFDNSALNPLKSLVPAQDKIPYYTGANTASLLDISGVGKDLIAEDTIAGIRTLLELVKQTSVTDTNAGRLLINGAFGLGATQSPGVTNIDATTTRNGFYRVTTSTVTGTLPATVGTNDGLFVLKISSIIAIQIYFSSHADSPVYYRRSTNGTTWQPWRAFSLT